MFLNVPEGLHILLTRDSAQGDDWHQKVLTDTPSMWPKFEHATSMLQCAYYPAQEQMYIHQLPTAPAVYLFRKFTNSKSNSSTGIYQPNYIVKIKLWHENCNCVLQLNREVLDSFLIFLPSHSPEKGSDLHFSPL